MGLEFGDEADFRGGLASEIPSPEPKHHTLSERERYHMAETSRRSVSAVEDHPSSGFGCSVINQSFLTR